MENKELLEKILANQVVLFKMLTELTDKQKGISRGGAYTALVKELDKEAEKVRQALKA